MAMEELEARVLRCERCGSGRFVALELTVVTVEPVTFEVDERGEARMVEMDETALASIFPPDGTLVVGRMCAECGAVYVTPRSFSADEVEAAVRRAIGEDEEAGAAP